MAPRSEVFEPYQIQGSQPNTLVLYKVVAQLIPRKCWEPLPRHIEIDMLTSARSGAGEEGCQQAKDIHTEAMTMRHADDFGLAKALKANTTVSIAEISPVMRGTYK